MALFEVPKRATKSIDAKIAKRSNSRIQIAPAVVKGGGSILDKINLIKSTVETNLGKYRDEYKVITDIHELTDYIDKSLSNGYISIDTETDGLDPLLNKLAGICVYTRNEKGAYIPLNHISYITNERVPGLIYQESAMKQFQRLKDIDIDMFNAKFDIRFLRANGWKEAYCTWDGYLASRLMNENEEHKNLKQLHQKYCLKGQGDAFRFDDLFKGIPFTMIPYNVGYLYAAHDPVITTELCDYQRQWLRADSDREDMRKLYWVMENIEMPCVNVVCDMEDNGILFDMDYQQELSEKYNKLLEEKVAEFNILIDTYTFKGKKGDIVKLSNVLNDVHILNPNIKLDDPVNIASPTQIAILLYDILGLDSGDKKNPRGTGADVLSKMDNPIAKAVLEYREVAKLISTYIDKLPNCVNPNDGRIHCSFNQYGADTGRMSSSEPNLQNIPSHNKDIRKMFVASEGYVLMSSDYSQQEPRSLAALCKKQGDSQMYETFMAGKDLYSEIASKAFNKPYEECKEFRPDGTVNKEGKERRTQAKSILLGVLYGRGEASIGEQLHCTSQKAHEIKESVFRGFPAIKKFEQDSLDMAYELGYVTTVCGRKRRLPDLQLDEFEFKWKDGTPPDDDLLDFSKPYVEPEIPPELIRSYLRRLKNTWGAGKRKIFEEANKKGIWVIDNGGKIADATRQCVNARIQGSAADLTKLAMIELNNNQRLKELGFRLLIPVHDEVIAECPVENVKECSELLASTMSKAAEQILEMPIGCDVEITREWYGLPFAVSDFYDERGNLKPESEWRKNTTEV